MRKRHKQILKRLGKARDFPTKTCPSSRHVHMIVEGLLDPKDARNLALAKAGYEPEHMAESIATVLQCLWEARRYLKWETLPPTKEHPHNGHWVPDLEAIDRLNSAAVLSTLEESE